MTKGAVNPVPNEGPCGATWAISSVAVVEGQHEINTGKLHQLSAQQVMDCDKQSQSCNGGFPVYAFEYIEKAGGLALAKDYPYKGAFEKCYDDKVKKAVQVKSIKKVTPDSVEQLKAAIA